MSKLLVKNYLEEASNLVKYEDSWRAMRNWTNERSNDTVDQLWVMEHAPVFTLGQAGDASHILRKSDIPVVQSDRGGQVTYHGPGQFMFYSLFNLRRLNISVRACVELLEAVVVEVLSGYDISAKGNREAPGVYVDGEKIAALGLRVRKGCTYHGLCFNYDFDAQPFSDINPCGYDGLKVCQLSSLISERDARLPSRQALLDAFVQAYKRQFKYSEADIVKIKWPEAH